MAIAPDVEKLADELRSISSGIRKLLDGPLTERAIIILVHHNTSPKVPMKTITEVLHSLADLDNVYCNDPDGDV